VGRKGRGKARQGTGQVRTDEDMGAMSALAEPSPSSATGPVATARTIYYIPLEYTRFDLLYSTNTLEYTLAFTDNP
jgi:hypothetical protein